MKTRILHPVRRRWLACERGLDGGASGAPLPRACSTPGSLARLRPSTTRALVYLRSLSPHYQVCVGQAGASLAGHAVIELAHTNTKLLIDRKILQCHEPQAALDDEFYMTGFGEADCMSIGTLQYIRYALIVEEV